ncbi:hypothetical protein SNEBB_007267 [Seison nebaliae]|nr:hypothetical protein SNEBB_007267 [Seison nebaliae]
MLLSNYSRNKNNVSLEKTSKLPNKPFVKSKINRSETRSSQENLPYSNQFYGNYIQTNSLIDNDSNNNTNHDKKMYVYDEIFPSRGSSSTKVKDSLNLLNEGIEKCQKEVKQLRLIRQSADRFVVKHFEDDNVSSNSKTVKRSYESESASNQYGIPRSPLRNEYYSQYEVEDSAKPTTAAAQYYTTSYLPSDLDNKVYPSSNIKETKRFTTPKDSTMKMMAKNYQFTKMPTELYETSSEEYSSTGKTQQRTNTKPTQNIIETPTQRIVGNPMEHIIVYPSEKPEKERTENYTRQQTESIARKPMENLTRKPKENLTRKPKENPSRKPTENLTSRQTENLTRKQTPNFSSRQTENLSGNLIPSRQTGNFSRKPTENFIRKKTEKTTSRLIDNTTRESIDNTSQQPTENTMERAIEIIKSRTDDKSRNLTMERTNNKTSEKNYSKTLETSNNKTSAGPISKKVSSTVVYEKMMHYTSPNGLIGTPNSNNIQSYSKKHILLDLPLSGVTVKESDYSPQETVNMPIIKTPDVEDKNSIKNSEPTKPYENTHIDDYESKRFYETTTRKISKITQLSDGIALHIIQLQQQMCGGEESEHNDISVRVPHEPIKQVIVERAPKEKIVYQKSPPSHQPNHTTEFYTVILMIGLLFFSDEKTEILSLIHH